MPSYLGVVHEAVNRIHCMENNANKFGGWSEHEQSAYRRLPTSCALFSPPHSHLPSEENNAKKKRQATVNTGCCKGWQQRSSASTSLLRTSRASFSTDGTAGALPQLFFTMLFFWGARLPHSLGVWVGTKNLFCCWLGSYAWITSEQCLLFMFF